MSGLATRPFEAQLAAIDAAVEAGEARALLGEVGALTDPEPLAYLLRGLTARGPTDDALRAALGPVLAGLPDPSLPFVFASAARGSALDALLRDVASDALATWPATRPSALAFLARWLRRRHPEAHAALLARAAAEVDGPPGDGRWALFIPGARLAERAADPVWGPVAREALAVAVDALARAPKSISQVNAERLLASRVYADPGHFLFELLQNADDAGARAWSARLEPTRAVIVNDGEPFSFLDLVGVLSIGQTTKAAAQIGFFGVGFKSVYEVCVRPRVHSGALDVEIAHVSIPRQIERPDDVSPGATTLVLPFRAGVDVASLTAHAARIPPETLMTLPHLEEVTLAGPDAPATRWRETRDGDRTELSCDDLGRDDLGRDDLGRDDTAERRRYRRAEAEVRFTGPREEGRPAESQVLVAAPLDADGRPAPRAHPTLFAFLPTAERTGLRVIVHARFDVTLDRERLELGSAWNDALLEAAGDALARLALEAVADGASPLPWLPDPREVSPRVEPTLARARAALHDAPCLPAADGGWLAPAHARLMPADLAHALAALDLGDGARALAPLDPREEAVARWLGACPLGDDALIGAIARALRSGQPPPPWLGPVVLEALGDAAVDDARLRDLPLLRDAQDNLRTVSEASAAPGPLATLYAGLRPLATEASLDALPERLRERLGARAFDPATLVEDLSGPLAEALLGREGALLRALGEADDALLGALRDVPILRGADGARWAIRDGLVRPAPGLEGIAAGLADAVPVIDPALAAAHRALVDRWVPAFDLPELADALDAGLLLAPDARRELATLLDLRAAALPRGLARRLAGWPLFTDHLGALRPLEGEGRAIWTRDASLPPLLPSWPWLADPEAAFVRALEPPAVGVEQVADALTSGAPPIDAAALEGLYGWLGARAGALSTGATDALTEAPIWVDLEGRPRRLDSLRRGTGGTAIDAWYAAVGGREVAHPAALGLLEALRRADRLAATDHDALVRDLIARGEAPEVPPALLARVLEEAAREVPPEALAPLARLPLFEDEGGARRPLGGWSAPDPEAAHRPGPFREALRAGALPLVSAACERDFAGLLAIVGPAGAGPRDLVAQADRLLDAPDALLDALTPCSSELGAEDRAALARLPLLERADGERGAAQELVDPTPFAETLGDARLAMLELDSSLLSSDGLRRARAFALPLRAAEGLLRELTAALEEGAPLAAQPAPWGDVEALWALAALHLQLAVDPREAPLGVDARGHLARPPLFAASEAARALTAALPLRARLADEGWAEGAQDTLLAPLPARAVAEALREACPEERPREGHPVIADTGALYAWLREARAALEEDEPALAALGAAAILPSQRGTLRRARDLVLGPDLPDLGLGWGLASDAPDDLARWLGVAFELERAARRAVVDHVLDGIDEAAEADDRTRAGELLRFLAGALGAGAVGPDELESRVRRGKVRARLRVPVEGGGWDKPRFAWAPSDEVADHLVEVTDALPPRIALPGADPATRRLLAACGARADLDDGAVAALLDGEGLRPGLAARRALARYVAVRALARPARIDAWRLRTRAWVPDRADRVRRPPELLWPDPLAVELFGDDAARFPDPELGFDLTAADGRRLGFATADALTLADIASHARGREARAGLLGWLEAGLRDGTLEAKAVRRALGEAILLRDDEGEARPPSELAVRDARALFGRLRGDFGAGADYPALTDALGIPPRPHAAMITRFLVEVGEDLAELPEAGREELARRLPEVYERLAERVAAGEGASLPDGAAIAARVLEETRLCRIGEPSLTLLEPVELAEVLPASALARLADPLPAFDRPPALLGLLFAAGIGDLLARFRAREALTGPRRDDLDADAEALRAALAEALGDAVGQRARVVEGLRARGTLELRASDDYRSAPGLDATVEVDAAIVDGVLWLTPQALRDPTLLAPALAPEPRRRAATQRWLAEGRFGEAPKKVKTPSEPERAPRPAREGLWSRLKRAFGARDDRRESAKEAPTLPSSGRSGRGHGRPEGPVGEGFFRPGGEIGPQLEGTDGWLEDRRRAPDFGFAFSPSRLPAPWLYAPKLVATRFDRRGQRWERASLRRPEVARAEAGAVVLRGTLPRGDAVLPLPLYGKVVALDAEDARLVTGPDGGPLLRLERAGPVRLKVGLGPAPSLERARPLALPEALASFVPDAELPDEVHALLDDLDPDASPWERAVTIRDFVRTRYRYDPSYLEDASVGRWLARVTRGRASAHVAALHAAGDGEHLGAGVCYELNALACELLRRAGVPAAIATGWVFTGGSLAEPDHLWTLALLVDEAGAPIWAPIDASTTRDGRPLRVPRRPAGRFKPPRAREGRAPATPRWDDASPSGPGGPGGSGPRRRRRPPRVELHRLLRHLERLSGDALTDEERAALEDALADRAEARALLRRLKG